MARQLIVGKRIWWHLLRLTGRDGDLNLRRYQTEFDAWRWNDYWVDLDGVIEFKRDVYRRALNEALSASGQTLRAARAFVCGLQLHSPPEGAIGNFR